MLELPRSVLLKLLSFSWPTPSDAVLRGREAIEWSDIKVKRPILDIGCADGQIGEVVFHNLPKIDVGIDLDIGYITRAQSSPKYRRVLVSDARKILLPPHSFNTVISNSTFEHIAGSDLPALKEVHRVLKSKGKFYLTVPSKRFGELFPADYNNRAAHFRYRSLAEWEKVLTDSDFTLLDHKYYFSVSVIPIWYKLFKISTTKIFHRELWSWLRDSRFSRLIPKNLLISLMTPIINSLINQSDRGLGTWLFLAAQKK